eukprot:TRINITY_DN6294_c0_g1_i7.p1 TRINITY_DN6294_c0_g1~~TRINITY_DN6294_c0_g1_i7.p1  ORF type:complete len:1148 (+),score=189.53 TRINITY_DN6294_c0_g1_i7:67-3510(+)
MAALAVGGIMASKAVATYNRKNFLLDQRLMQERQFQEQEMRVEQFALYREDVRSLVELTVGKMDVYLIACALLIDKTTVLFAKQAEVLPSGSAMWAIALNSLTLCCGIFYLLLSLWMAMYASISAQSFGARLLTQFVRLPYATKGQIDSANARAAEFEATGVKEILRIPFTGRPDSATRGVGAVKEGTTSSPSGGTTDLWRDAASAANRGPRGDAGGPIAIGPPTALSPPAGDASTGGEGDPSSRESPVAVVEDITLQDIMPTAMLDHIRLYRRVQLNWQAYDAYARVSLFVGANSLLASCLYWCLGQLLKAWSTALPSIGCAAIFASIQLSLISLDLRLSRRSFYGVAVVLISAPMLATVGLVLQRHWETKVRNDDLHHESFHHVAISVLVIFCHGMHAVLFSLVLKGSWPDPAVGEDARLPAKFRSALFLDVFGWLLNPDGPGTQSSEEDHVEECSDFEEEEELNSEFDTSSFSRRRQESAASSASGTSTVQRSPIFSNVTAGMGAEVHLSASLPAPSPGTSSDDGRRSPPLRQTMPPAIGFSDDLRAEAHRLLHPDGTASPIHRSRTSSHIGTPPVHSLVRRPSPMVSVQQAQQAARMTPPVGSTHSSPRSTPLGSRLTVPSASRELTNSPQLGGGLTRIPSPRSTRLEGLTRTPSPRSTRLEVPVGSGVSRLSNTTPSTGTVRFGGHEAASAEEMERVNAPTREGATNFSGTRAPKRISERTQVPGETPWQAFLQGTVVIIFVWIVSTMWCVWHSVYDSWLPQGVKREHHPEHFLRERPQFGIAGVCAPGRLPPQARLVHTSLVELLGEEQLGVAQPVENAVPGPGGAWSNVLGDDEVSRETVQTSRSLRTLLRTRGVVARDGGCNLRQPVAGMSLACRQSGDLSSGQCFLAVLRRGGRALSLCRVEASGRVAGGSGDLRLVPTTTLRLVSGAPSLRYVALGWRSGTSGKSFDLGGGGGNTGRGSGAWPFVGAAAARRGDGRGGVINDDLRALRVFGRGITGDLLAFRIGATASRQDRALLFPESELEPPLRGFKSAQAEADRYGAEEQSERLLVVGDVLLSLQTQWDSPCGAATGMGNCPSFATAVANGNGGEVLGAPVLRTWHLGSGHREQYLAASDEPMEALRALCDAEGDHGTQTRFEF